MRLSIKILMVFGMTIALMVPITMIRGTVADRQQYRAQAVEEIARSTAGAQAVAGPVLFVPYSDRVVVMQANASGVPRPVEQLETGTWMFFPASLGARGTLRSLPRMRGLHEVRVFELDTTQRAVFRAKIPRDDDPANPRPNGGPRAGGGPRPAPGCGLPREDPPRGRAGDAAQHR